MEWQQNIQIQGKQVQIFRFKDICPIKVVKSRDDKICCINSQFILRLFNLKTLKMEIEKSISDTMPQELLTYYKPIYYSQQYIYHQSNFLNIEQRQQNYIDKNYALVYIDEENLYGYRIIKSRQYHYDLSVVQLNQFGKIISQIYEQNLQSVHFLINKYFIIVQQPSLWFRIDLIKKQRKIRFQVKEMNFNFQIISLKNNQFMLIHQSSHHVIKLQHQLKLIRKIIKFPNFDTVCGSLCIKFLNCDKSQIKISYFDYASLQQGEISDVFEKINLTFVENSRNLIFASDNQVNIFKFKNE